MDGVSNKVNRNVLVKSRHSVVCSALEEVGNSVSLYNL